METGLLEKTFTPLYKRCSLCGLEKSIGEFNKDSRLKSGLRSSCRECNREHGRKYWASEAGRAIRARYIYPESYWIWRRLYQQSLCRKNYERERSRDANHIRYQREYHHRWYQEKKTLMGHNVMRMHPGYRFLKALEEV